MPNKSFLSLTGFIVLIIATWCPLVKPFGLGNMDIYDLKQGFGIAVLLVGVIGLAGLVLRQPGIAKISSWAALALVLLFYAGVQFQVHHFFNFIPFGSVVRFLTRQIRFKWGWYLLFCGPLLAVIGISTTKRSAAPSNIQQKQN